MKQFRDYTAYSLEDLISHPDFIRWVREGREDDNEFWGKWLAENTDKQALIEEARLILLSMKMKEHHISDREVEEQSAAILKMMEGQRVKRGLFVQMGRWKYAAIFLILVATAAVFSYLRQTSGGKEFAGTPAEKNAGGLVEQRNTGAADKELTLPDGSLIRLSPGASVRYSSGSFMAGKNRDVSLSGQAFFQVVKRTGEPFRVFSHELVINVLGTSFTVHSTEGGKTVSVVVHTGKVSVLNHETSGDQADKKQIPGVLLTANQQLLYSQSDHKFQKTLVERPVMVNRAAIASSFKYENALVTKVLEDIEHAFDLDIVYDSEAIKNCRITVDLSSESVYEKLDLICAPLNARYAVIDGQVVIQTPAPCH